MKGKTGPKESFVCREGPSYLYYCKVVATGLYLIRVFTRRAQLSLLQLSSWKRGGLPLGRGQDQEVSSWSCFRMTFDTPEENGKRDINSAALNARSREKTGLKAHEGDEDLVDYYYLVMNPNTRHGLDLRLTDGKRFRVDACPRLKERFPNSFRCVPCVSSVVKTRSTSAISH